MALCRQRGEAQVRQDVIPVIRDGTRAGILDWGAHSVFSCACRIDVVMRPLRIPVADARFLLERLGPSLALWRAAEVAALREQAYAPPVLDLGCGDGLVTALALGGPVMVGVDPDGRALARARARGLYRRLLARPVEEIGAREVPPGSIGTVVSNSALEHLPRLDATLAAVERALRPGGQLIFTVPTETFSRWLALPSARYAAWRNHRLEHRALEPVEAWAERLARAGLALEGVRPYLRRSLVTLWDALELTQQVWIGERRVVSLLWRRLPPRMLDALARRLAAVDLSAPYQSGGRLFVARKPG